ncbi:MAG: peptide chain release factor N(5)-glutamine methyltransferase [Xanthomonadaceae bacterium]|nr:peptide chain release factor N(5)-glutamine methyltransferase [Xanthomonadaceae bacterium]
MKVSDLLFTLSEIIKVSAEQEQIIEWALLQSTGRTWKRSEWMMSSDQNVSEVYSDQAIILAKRRAEGFPLQYLTHEQSFYGRSFYVEEGVLVPRPETEILVDEVLKRLKARSEEKLLGFELGLGAGPIAITLLTEIPELRMIGTELSEIAIRVTNINSDKHLKDPSRLEIVSEIQNKIFNFIVSNPPYLDRSKHEVDADVAKYEPSTALFAPENDPLYFYKHLRDLSIKNLKRGGFLAIEIPHDRVEAVSQLFSDRKWSMLKIIPDLNSRPRVLVVTLSS